MMRISKKMRTKIIYLAIAVLIFVYWRGVKAISAEKNLECNYHLVYAVCKQKGKATELPTFFEVLKAGAKF